MSTMKELEVLSGHTHLQAFPQQAMDHKSSRGKGDLTTPAGTVVQTGIENWLRAEHRGHLS